MFNMVFLLREFSREIGILRFNIYGNVLYFGK